MAFPPSHAAPAPPPRAGAEPASVGVAYYRTGHELRFYLRALRRVRVGRLVVVLGLQGPDQPPPVEEAAGVRIVHTAHGTDPGSGGVVGWFVPDPVEAVVLAMTGLRPRDGLILLFPADWRGDPPEFLLEKARSRRAGRTNPPAGAGRGANDVRGPGPSPSPPETR